MIKLSRRVSVIVILALTALFIVGGCAIAKFGFSAVTTEYSTKKTSSSEQSAADKELQSYQAKLADIQAKLKTADENSAPALKAQEAELKATVEMYKKAADAGVSLSGSSYIADAIKELSSLKAEISELNAVPESARTDEMKKRLTVCNSYTALLQKAADEKSYRAYLEYSDAVIRADTALSSGEKNIKLASNALRLRYDPDGAAKDTYNNLNTENAIKTIEDEKLSLFTGTDVAGTMAPLTEDARESIKNKSAVDLYKLENGMSLHSSSGSDLGMIAFSVMYSFAGMMLTILMMVLAGGSFSTEVSTGSIKSLIIAPVRRWKIYTAKLLSLITVLLLSGLFVYGVSVAAFAGFFGMGTGNPYISASGGHVHAMSFALYNFAYLYASLISVFVLMTLAFMLSIVTKNTAASVGLSIGFYFGGSIVHSLITSFASGEWIKFLPFSNLSLESVIFPAASSQIISVSGASSSGLNLTAAPTLTFSLWYLAAVVFLMCYTGFDSFTRRDIK
jgi:ABC-type transport system involved in multi-copper enzyme maturation permease subunit